ncbi:MAG: nucleotide exchange factor GrpE [Chitinophagales bacterium]
MSKKDINVNIAEENNTPVNVEIEKEEILTETEKTNDETTAEKTIEVEESVETKTVEEPKIDEIAVLKTEIKDWKDKYLRLYAEFDNFRRRKAREQLELTKTAGKDIIVNLLPILDDFERAFKAREGKENGDSIKGFELIYHKLQKNLEQKGLKAMESIGQNFDADSHDAIAEIPAPTENLKDKVIDEVEKGYFLGDKIIRYAKVVVGK